MSDDHSGYLDAAKAVRVSPRPIPIRRGEWWFHRWIVTAPSLEGMGNFAVPVPTYEGSIVATVLLSKAQQVVVEIGERYEELSANALTYAAMIVSELRCQLGEGTAVDGDVRHTLFLLVKWDCDHNADRQVITPE